MNQSAVETLYGIDVCYEKSCLKSLQKLGDTAMADFMNMTLKILSDPGANGLNVEPIEGGGDPSLRSVRLDRGRRAIGSLQGSTMIFLHVNEHDKAYRWAQGRRVSFDNKTRRIRVVEATLAREEVPPSPEPFRQPGLFDGVTDEALRDLGLGDGEILRARAVINDADLDRLEDEIDSTSHEILTALAMGYAPQDIPALIAGEDAGSEEKSIEDAIRSDEGRATIFVPESEAELRRVLDGDQQGWRVFLHPEQRKHAYRDYNGPALVRGGAGTGKTVVAMHRAKHIADQIAADPARAGEKVLFTTFTVNLAKDIAANLRSLCPEHLAGASPRIEVRNLDAWASEFLRRRSYGRTIVFNDSDERIVSIWNEILENSDLPDGITSEFVQNEWIQIVRAKGLDSKGDYFKASRTGRGTPLDRRKRAALWPLFETFRARLREEQIVQPDDAYREAVLMLARDGSTLPYASVVVDEGQDMGEQAFRLIAAIAEGGPGGPQNSLFIVGDAHQRIYARKASLSACGVNVRGRSRRLRLNYRTSDAIRKWAVSILEGLDVDDLDEDLDSLKGYRSAFNGPAPSLSEHATLSQELAQVIEKIEGLPEEGSICVLGRTRKVIDLAAQLLEGHGQSVVRLAEGKEDPVNVVGVRVATMHRSKGLEFDVVFLVGVSDGIIPPPAALRAAVDTAGKREVIEREKSLIHVAATRAKRQLFVSWNGKPSIVLPSAAS